MPKTRRKQRKRKSRKKRGGEMNPFMFKSTHNLQMNKMQKQIDDRDKQINAIMNEAMKEIDLKKGVMKDLSEEQHEHLKDNVHNKLAKAKQKLKEQSAEKFKDDLIKDLKEKAGELNASEEKLQNCDQIKEGLNKAFNELQEYYNKLDENFNHFIHKSRRKMKKLEKEQEETSDFTYVLRKIIKDLQGVKCNKRAKNADLICDALREIINDKNEDESVKNIAKQQCIYLSNGKMGKKRKPLCKLKNENEEEIEDEDDLKDGEIYYCNHGFPYGHVNRFTGEEMGGGRKRRRKSRKRKSKKKRRRRKRKRTKKKRRRKSRR